MGRIAEISRRRRRRHRMAAVETQSMIARVLLIRKLSSSALPFQSHFVFGHIFYVGHATARRNRLRHALAFKRCPLYPRKQTSVSTIGTSAMGQRQTLLSTFKVSFGGSARTSVCASTCRHPA